MLINFERIALLLTVVEKTEGKENEGLRPIRDAALAELTEHARRYRDPNEAAKNYPSRE